MLHGARIHHPCGYPGQPFAHATCGPRASTQFNVSFWGRQQAVRQSQNNQQQVQEPVESQGWVAQPPVSEMVMQVGGFITRSLQLSYLDAV